MRRLGFEARSVPRAGGQCGQEREELKFITFQSESWESSYDLGQKQDALQFASPQKAYHYLKTGEEKNQLCYANCLLNSVTRVASDSDIEPCIEKHNPSVIHKERSKLLLIKSVTHAK